MISLIHWIKSAAQQEKVYIHLDSLLLGERFSQTVIAQL